jgi:hypothetical protein
MLLTILYKIVYFCIGAAIAIGLFQATSLKAKASYAIVALPLLLRLFGIK